MKFKKGDKVLKNGIPETIITIDSIGTDIVYLITSNENAENPFCNRIFPGGDDDGKFFANQIELDEFMSEHELNQDTFPPGSWLEWVNERELVAADTIDSVIYFIRKEINKK